MKLIRFGDAGKEKPGIMQDGIYYDASDLVSDFNEDFFSSGLMNEFQSLSAPRLSQLPRIDAGTRLGCPVSRPSKIVCIGLNYADHAKETSAPFPPEPVIFLKSTTAIIGPNDNVQIPRNSLKTDWEVELAIVIGKKATYVEEKEAMKHVAGYCLHNDISEREFQLERNGTWDKGKGCDTFAPIGPFLATQDEIGDVNNLRLWLTVNGRLMQDGNTSNFIFKIPFIISYVSQFMTLLPGDIISTGTPAGVGLGQKPVPFYLKPGDVMELGIDGLGTSRQVVE
ncbi:MAG TPA: fumarylacetoacetate hydrolase family protein [Chitinophagaceae bacterium]|nr:fumarylacetoacetate hydrolase family protein [Chitinophagaceae bacterium]